MPEHASTDHAELAAALSAMRLGVGASELHGSLCGYLCGGGDAGPKAFLSALELQGNDAHPDEATQALLAEMYAETRVQLEDPELGFQPLLPDGSHPLAERGDALVEWCRGFLGGLGLGGFGGRRRLSEEGSEILHDLDAIAAAHFSYDNEDDETSLTEVFEFVRISVLLVYAEMRDDPGERLH
ncbi:MAG TPA: UPF0149 family protein [Rhodanobacteraceae bacterium]|nr:UPF0149 family protein [Rhodanobacteraceae bacterium]